MQQTLRHMNLTLKYGEAYQSLIEKSVAQLGKLLALEKHHCFRINLVLDEICTNIFENNLDTENLRIDISIVSNQKEITIVFEDNGIPFDPTGIDEPDIHLPLGRREAGGLGIYFVKKYSKLLDYSLINGRNRTTVTMSFTNANSSTSSGCHDYNNTDS